MTVKRLFIAIVFAGAGGTANLFYTFYLRDKNIGMGARLPSLLNPLRGRDETISSTGFMCEETEENKRRFSAWWKYIKQDQIIFFWALNTITIMLFIFGALCSPTPTRYYSRKRATHLRRSKHIKRHLGNARTVYLSTRRRGNAFRDTTGIGRWRRTFYFGHYLHKLQRCQKTHFELVVSPHSRHLDCWRMCDNFCDGTVKRQ